MSTTIVKACGVWIAGCILVLATGCTADDQPGTATSTGASPSTTTTAVVGRLAVINATANSGQSLEAEMDAGKLARQAASPDLSKALCRDIVQCPPPPPRSRYVNHQGFFDLPEWDDRNLTDEEKAQDPWRDPFWPAFVQCLQDAGVGVGVTTPEGATQADIDLLVAEVNESGPAYVASPTGLQYQSTPASDAFLECEKPLYNQRPSGGQ